MTSQIVGGGGGGWQWCNLTRWQQVKEICGHVPGDF